MANDPIIIARVLMCLLGIAPAAAGYYWAQYYDYFPQKSLKKFGLMLLVMFLYVGTFFIQIQVYRVVSHKLKGDLFFTILITVQYLFAVVISFTTLSKHEKMKRRNDKESRRDAKPKLK